LPAPAAARTICTPAPDEVSAHELGLLAAQRATLDRLLDEVISCPANPRSAALVSAVEQTAFEADLLGRRVADLLTGDGDPHDVALGEHRVGAGLKLGRRGTLAVRGGDGLEHVAARERARLRGQLADIDRVGQRRRKAAGQQRLAARTVKAVLGGARAPLLAQALHRHP